MSHKGTRFDQNYTKKVIITILMCIFINFDYISDFNM
jgi:hypothetical protein